MTKFNVLDRNLRLDSNYLLEASAGTGKTFSIENIFIRLLVEQSVPIQEILVVTFTRAATRDLKLRIRQNLNFVLECLSGGREDIPDYLLKILEGEESAARAKRKIKQALLRFDEAQIYTIHGFCAKKLLEHHFEGDLGIDAFNSEETISKTEIVRVIRDFCRTELRAEGYRVEELKIILKQYSMEQLERKLQTVLSKGKRVLAIPPSDEMVSQFQKTMRELKEARGYRASTILEDFYFLAPLHTKLCNRSKKIKEDVLSRVENFAKLFDQSEWEEKDLANLIEDQLFFVQAFDEKNRGAKYDSADFGKMHDPDLIETLKKALLPFTSPSALFARLASDSQKIFEKYIWEEEKFGHDQILQKMRDAIQNADFAGKVSGNYHCAIIDEFQDTDPTQWEIFRELFLRKRLYIVGDPKQSIYAFRQADIYTYLDAANAIETHATLETNYRSQPSLIHAVNCLFSAEHVPKLISLPKIKDFLRYLPIQAPPGRSEKEFSDDRASLHFMIAKDETAKSVPLAQLENDYYFPFITQEIQRLHHEDGISWNGFALLVADRYQSDRAAEYLKKWKIPLQKQREDLLSNSPVLSSFQELLEAVLNPRDESALRVALGGKIIGWTNEEILAMEREKTIPQFYTLHRILFEDGFAVFFDHLLQSRWFTESVEEKLLSIEEGEQFYRDLCQISEMLMDFECSRGASPEQLLVYLNDFKKIADDEEESFKKLSDPDEEGVHLLTLHSSKGLEYDVVFAIGIIRRSRQPEDLIPCEEGSEQCLKPIFDPNEEEYIDYCRELDAEKMRQFYVGATRAKFRVYLPVALIPNGSALEGGTASPMELYLAHLEKPSEDLYEVIQGYNGDSLYRFLHKMQGVMTYTDLNETQCNIILEKEEEIAALIEPEKVLVSGKYVQIHSYTTLVKQMAHEKLSDAPHDFHAETKNAFSLPAGANSGILLHLLLEKIPFDCSDFVAAVKPFLEGTPYLEWHNVIAKLTENAFQTPFVNGTSLSQIDPNACFRETEFLTTHPDGYLKGVIDLFFAHEDKYYLLDWKSNWLGNAPEDYSQTRLEQAMTENHYHFQADLYKDALKRYLKIFDSRPFEEIFGGTFYLFLRGLNGTDAGVYKIT